MRALVLLAVLFVPEASASEVLNNISDSYQDATSGWYNTIFPFAQRLFFVLAVIELTWTGLLWALNRDDPGSVLSGLLRKLLALGLFYAILLNAHVWIPAILDSFMGIGAAASGVPVLDPSTVVDQGVEVATALLSNLSILGVISSPSGSLLAVMAALIVGIAFAVIAGQLLITLIESYIVIGGGILMLGFAGSRWTSAFAEKFLGYAIAVGVKLFVLYLIIGVGSSIAPSWMPLIESASQFNPAPVIEVIISAMIFAFLAWSIPSTAGSLIAGSVSMTLGGAAGAGILTGAGILGAGAAGGMALNKSMQTLNTSLKQLNQGVKSLAGSGANPTVAAAGQAGQAARGNPALQSAAARRGGAFRQPWKARHGSKALAVAHHLPRDQGGEQTADVKLKTD